MILYDQLIVNVICERDETFICLLFMYTLGKILPHQRFAWQERDIMVLARDLQGSRPTLAALELRDVAPHP